MRTDQISEEARILVQAVARAIFTDDRGTFEDQLERKNRLLGAVPLLKPKKAIRVENYEAVESTGQDLIFFNGLGGFTQDGREYIIQIAPGKATPAPWSNVISNPHFGTVISERGGAYTWGENSQQFRLTPWYNDPVGDASGEALYIRDEESGQFWSAAAQPAQGETPYTCRHGFGYSVFEHKEFGIASELWVYVAVDAPIKFSVLKVRNESGASRRLSVTSYIELVLGEMHSKTGMHIITEIDPRTGALFARNPYNTDFPERIVFLDLNEEVGSFTGDRTEFLGRNGKTARPAALAREQLLEPPFDKSEMDPGYIKGYIPGVRENGGQYTHAAIWVAMAFAAMGDSTRAWKLLDMINPLNHGSTPEEVAVYRVEPYIVAADVYALQPHTGRGGWTWYTGAAGWMYRLIVESLLGLRLDVDRLRFTPCLPADWKSFLLHYRYRETFYHITVTRSGPWLQRG